MSPQLAGLATGVLLALTTLAVAAAAHPADATPARRRRLAVRLHDQRRLLVTAGITLGVLVPTRVIPLAIGAGVTLWLVPAMVDARRQRLGEQQTLEAVHAWLIQLQAVLAAGSGLEQALREVAVIQPSGSPLASATSRLAARIERLGPIPALRSFAAEVDNHVADAAVTVLTQAFARQASGVADALEGIIAWAEQDVRQRRDIDARLQSVRTERWLIVAIFAAIAAYFTVANGELMAVYTRPVGQVVLAAILSVTGLLLWGLERVARPPRPVRFFAHGQGG